LGAVETDVPKSTPGHGGKRSGAGRPPGSGRKPKVEQNDAYTLLAKAKAKKSTGNLIENNREVADEMLIKHINFGDKEVVLDMVSALDIETEDIEEELRKQAGSFGFVSVCYEVASRRSDQEKAKLSEVTAKRYFELKTGDFNELYPGVKMTEDGVKHALTTDPEVKAQDDLYRKANHDASVLLAYRHSLLQKKDMIQSLNSTINRDYK